ncbi:MAG: hypothetical protein AB2385_01605 [Symbiobacterium sp.]|uniref:hypothetical protein n=1 Tax=Symbiobacterium sp. TaxID=1971213 RepID=UPI003464A2CD
MDAARKPGFAEQVPAGPLGTAPAAPAETVRQAPGEAGTAARSERQFRIYEIFVQKDHLSPHVWVGSVAAGGPEEALVLAREQFLRRDAAVSIWAVEQQAIHRTDYADRDFFARETDKRYRTLAGYSQANAERWRKYRRALLDLEQDFVRD